MLGKPYFELFNFNFLSRNKNSFSPFLRISYFATDIWKFFFCNAHKTEDTIPSHPCIWLSSVHVCTSCNCRFPLQKWLSITAHSLSHSHVSEVNATNCLWKYVYVWPVMSAQPKRYTIPHHITSHHTTRYDINAFVIYSLSPLSHLVWWLYTYVSVGVVCL